MTIPSVAKLKALKKKLEESALFDQKLRNEKPNTVPRGEGPGPAVKETEISHGKQGAMNDTTVKGVDRKEGPGAGPQETDVKHGVQGKMSDTKVKGVTRGEGPGAADAKGWLSPENFRKHLRAELGLSLDSPLNKGNDGLNKTKKGDTNVADNKAGTPVDKATPK